MIRKVLIIAALLFTAQVYAQRVDMPANAKTDAVSQAELNKLCSRNRTKEMCAFWQKSPTVSTSAA